MTYRGKPIEVLSSRTVFGKSVSRIRILADSRVIDVPTGELEEDHERICLPEIAFKAMVARIRNEVEAHAAMAPLESTIIPYGGRAAPHVLRYREEQGMMRTRREIR
jgi:hypothetical protein